MTFYLFLIHCHSSSHDGRLPCMRMPTRNIFAASHVVSVNVRYSTVSEVIISHVGMPKGMRAIITIGEVNGIIEHHTARGELGSLNTDIITIIDTMMGIMMMVLYCCPSCTESTAEPAAAYSEA